MEERALCEYGNMLARGNWNIEMVKDALMMKSKSYEVNAYGAPNNFLRKKLKAATRVIMTLVLYNIRPKSHTSSIPLDTSYLLYYILDNKYVDVDRIILNEIKMIVESGHRLGSKIPCNLAFPGLCSIARISMPPVVHETINGVVDDRYIERYCMTKGNRALKIHNLLLNNLLMR